MSDTKIPESTPFSVYCQARAVVSMGREYPTSMCGNDPRLLFAAAMGVEDGLLSKRKIEALGQLHALPTEAEMTETIDAIFGEASRPAIMHTRDPHVQQAACALGVEASESLELSWDWDIKDEDERRIVDVIIGGRFRPTRATWQKLIDAGLPMCSWEEASESWGLETVSAEPRSTEDDGIQLRRFAEGGRHGVMAADVVRWRSNGWLEPEGWKLTERGRKIALSTP